MLKRRPWNHQDIRQRSYSDSKVMSQIEEYVDVVDYWKQWKKSLQNKRMCAKLNVHQKIIMLNYA